METPQIKRNVMDRFDLSGKTAVVTGAAGNIGYHTALALAQAGADVAVVDLPVCLERAQENAASIAKECGVKAVGYGCELTEEDQVKALFDQIEADFGHVDIVHNNAGIGGSLTPDIEEWDAEHNMSGKHVSFCCLHSTFPFPEVWHTLNIEYHKLYKLSMDFS